jgi:WD40 repeat protein
MTGLAFSPDGSWLLRLYGRSTETPGDQLVVYRCSDWQVAWGLRVLPFYPEKLALSPDGRFAALGGLEVAPDVAMHSPIWIVDLLSHVIVRKINAFPADSTIAGLSWSPAGDRIVAGADVFNLYPGVNTIKVFAVATGKEIAGAQSPEQPKTAVQYACAGKCVVESGLTGAVIIWDASLRHVLQKIPAALGAVAVSPNLRFLALPAGSESGSRTGSRLEVWQLE